MTEIQRTFEPMLRERGLTIETTTHTFGRVGFTIKLPSGYEVSIQRSPFHYCNMRAGAGMYDTPDFEVAVFDREGQFVSFGNEQVIGWQSPEQVQEIIDRFSKDEDEDEDEDGAPCCPDPECGGNPCTFPGYADNH